MKSHNEFIEDVKEASSLPAKTCRALGPESEEDISMYAEESNHSPLNREVAPVPVQSHATSRGDDSEDVMERLKDGRGKVPHMSAMSGAKQEEAQNMIQKLKDNGQEEFLSRLTFS